VGTGDLVRIDMPNGEVDLGFVLELVGTRSVFSTTNTTMGDPC
jgi:hypothetical protein